MDLDIKRVLAAKPAPPEDVELAKLTTVWGDALNRRHVLESYPRPQLRRKAWTCLNGEWDYAIVDDEAARDRWATAEPPESWDGTIVVPFSPEATLSGAGRQLLPTQLLWYRRLLRIDAVGEERVLVLHFEAVDYACALYVNGTQVATHVGGYLPFAVDVTEAMRKGTNVIELCVYDPSEHGTQLRGKQRLVRGNMWYTAQSGIWQTVWLEELPARHVSLVRLHANPDAGTLCVDAQVSSPGAVLAIELRDADGKTVEHAEVLAKETTVRCELGVAKPHLWSPEDPYLYGVRIRYGKDKASSYCAFRTVGIEVDDKGIPRFCLNHQPYVVRGLLDQGYWPDGLMTAPADEALVADIVAAKDAGFNMLRKHIKRESDRWYYHCDRLGMLVWQDMVSGGGIPGEWTSVNIPTLLRRSWHSLGDTHPRQWGKMGAGDAAYREEWERTATSMVALLDSHPCIGSWVVFNESWGQFLSAQMTARLRDVDGTRPFVSTSGWYDQGAGDFVAVHNYFRGMRVYRDPHAGFGRFWGRRAFLIDEFGGYTLSVPGHVSVPTVYGYDSYESPEEWKAALDELLAEVDALEAQGLSGYVYTQLSDVEEETNGLLTYDRRVNKLNCSTRS